MASNPNASVKKYLPAHFLDVLGKNIPAIIEAVNTSNEKAEQLIQGAVEQLFLSTATGRFLVQLGEEQGFTMPANSGLDIRAYRVLVPIMVSNPKQVRISINDILQAFYKGERTHPYVQSSSFGPFSLNDGDDITIETEAGSVTVSVLSSQVSDITNVSVSEIAAIINSAQSLVLAESIKDRTTGNDQLRISSSTDGAGAYIRVAGGKLQNVLFLEKRIETSNDSSTTWSITKTSALSDEVKFTWNGLGTNPEIYLVKKGDLVTIRDLVNGVQQFSLLNGSYEAIDVGYDYFIVRNYQYTALSASLTQPDDNNIIFTKNERVTIFDRREYAVSSEIESQTITVTVPAVPPLTLRFLKGSLHLHGSESEVVDFTRSSIKLSLASGADKPTEDNLFLLKNNNARYDFKKKFYKTFSVDSNTQPTYQVDTNDDSRAVLPYTIPFSLGSNPIYGTVGRDEFYIDSPFRHGMERRWGFTLSGATGAGNITAPDLNTEHQTYAAPSETRFSFRIKDSNGNVIPFSGIAFGPCDVYRQSSPQSDGSDFYLQFSSIPAQVASGLQIGMIFRLDTSGGTNLDLNYSTSLRYRDLVVTGISGTKVSFSAGFGYGIGGQIISGVSGKRSGSFGGTPTYFLDKTSSYNQDVVFSDLKSLMVNYTDPTNPLYVGSYVYDPEGKYTSVTVSKYVSDLSSFVLRGDNVPALFVDSLDFDGEKFPQSGNIVVEYGTDRYEGPIRFFATIENPGSNQILIDPAYKFKYSHDIGAKVQYIRDNKAYSPKTDGSDYPVYFTGTSAARNTMFELIKLLTAAGIFVEKEVLLPDLRYDDLAILPFE